MAYVIVIACGVLALLYGWVTSRQVLAADAGTARMQEIAARSRTAPAPISTANTDDRASSASSS